MGGVQRRSQIDYIAVPTAMRRQVLACRPDDPTGPKADHRPVMCKLQLHKRLERRPFPPTVPGFQPETTQKPLKHWKPASTSGPQDLKLQDYHNTISQTIRPGDTISQITAAIHQAASAHQQPPAKRRQRDSPTTREARLQHRDADDEDKDTARRHLWQSIQADRRAATRLSKSSPWHSP